MKNKAQGRGRLHGRQWLAADAAHGLSRIGGASMQRESLPFMGRAERHSPSFTTGVQGRPLARQGGRTLALPAQFRMNSLRPEPARRRRRSPTRRASRSALPARGRDSRVQIRLRLCESSQTQSSSAGAGPSLVLRRQRRCSRSPPAKFPGRPRGYRGERISRMSGSLTFLRNVLRFRPRSSAALI